MPTYTEIINEFNEKVIVADFGDRIYYIPTNPANSDYQAYLNKDTLASELPTNPQAGE
jgi:hypothetical protein